MSDTSNQGQKRKKNNKKKPNNTGKEKTSLTLTQKQVSPLSNYPSCDYR